MLSCVGQIVMTGLEGGGDCVQEGGVVRGGGA